MKGITSSPMISRIDCGVTSTWEPSSAAASRGVKITPRTFDTDAELTARATLPRARGRADEGRRPRRAERPAGRETDEGAAEHEERERPRPEAGARLSGGELRAVEDEEQTDRRDGQSVERLGGPVANGKQRRHHRDEHQGGEERVDAKTAEDTHRTRFASKRHADNVIELDTVIG